MPEHDREERRRGRDSEGRDDRSNDRDGEGRGGYGHGWSRDYPRNYSRMGYGGGSAGYVDEENDRGYGRGMGGAGDWFDNDEERHREIERLREEQHNDRRNERREARPAPPKDPSSDFSTSYDRSYRKAVNDDSREQSADRSYEGEARRERRAEGPYAGIGPRGYRRSDERIKEDLCERLTWHSHIDPSDIDIQVQDSEVTLTGTVGSRAEKRIAEDIAESITGVWDVHNHLRLRGERPGSERRSPPGAASSGMEKKGPWTNEPPPEPENPTE